MDDPWDVKSVRLAGQYTSCMKINGVPLLPPVLSKECRKEMQYYKLLAKEVEKRISILEPYVIDNDLHSSEDRNDQKSIESSPPTSPLNNSLKSEQTIDVYSSPKHDVTVKSSQLEVDFNLCMNQTNVQNQKTIQSFSPCPPLDLPERDYNCISKHKEVLLDTETSNISKLSDRVDISFRFNKDEMHSHSPPGNNKTDEPMSINSKSFTGSLNDLFTSSVKEQDLKLARQRSYTILNPSPQLLAHLEVQSLNTGVEMNSISMSESLSNISSSPNKKRRSWDLESAKVKWSSMALELKQKNISNSRGTPMQNSPCAKARVARSPTKTARQTSPKRARSVFGDKKPTIHNKTGQKTELLQNTRKPSPLRNTPSNRTIVKEPIATKKREQSPKSPTSPNSPKSPKNLPIADPEDPATRVRELYEKIQKQQLAQMADLVEKQKREQLLLQQVFEEQNNLLFKQLKTICPKSPIEVKEAWGETQHGTDRGPVSLSQLINHKSQMSIIDSPASTLTSTNNHTENSNNVFKRSKNISGSSQKQRASTDKPRARSPTDGSRTRTHSPTEQKHASISRRLNYETGASSASDRDRDLEPMLTDRTNDTMADVNVTFPSDTETPSSSNKSKEMSIIHANLSDRQGCPSTDSEIRSMEHTIQNSKNSNRGERGKALCSKPPTPEQRAAASVIVAHARGYLVRRLFRTERVQTTVQTIKDALLCALQLHQDREGIRGADVDLHRRLIQQITAACYTLHDTFVSSTAGERCAVIAADRERRKLLATRPPIKAGKLTDIMSQSHCGAFPSRPKRKTTSSPMTQSINENYNTERSPRARYMPGPRPRPWR